MNDEVLLAESLFLCICDVALLVAIYKGFGMVWSTGIII